MELKQGRISITIEEFCEARKMGQSRMEQYLTEAMELGYRQGYTLSEEETDEEFRIAKEDRKAEICQALEENNRKWQRAVLETVAAVKGISKKRKELLMGHLKTKLEREGLCRK